MRTIGIFRRPAGTQVKLQTANPTAAIETYTVFVHAWTDDGKKPVATWHPEVLEDSGATLVLEGFRGYDIILKAMVNSDAAIDADLMFDGRSLFRRTVALPEVEGPVVVREWSIVVR